MFLPIEFCPGIVGRSKEYGAVVVTATLFSLLVSFTLTPLLAAKWSPKKRSEEPKWLGYLDNRVLDAVLVTVAVAMFLIGNATGWFLLNAFGVFIFALLLATRSFTVTKRFEVYHANKLLPFALAHGRFRRFYTSRSAPQRVRAGGQR